MVTSSVIAVVGAGVLGVELSEQEQSGPINVVKINALAVREAKVTSEISLTKWQCKPSVIGKGLRLRFEASTVWTLGNGKINSTLPDLRTAVPLRMLVATSCGRAWKGSAERLDSQMCPRQDAI